MSHLIYAIEDDIALQDLYQYSLENDFEYRGFIDGESFFEVLEKRESRNPDLILLDIMLPGDDGFTILNKLKSNAATKDIPVILVSAKGDEFSKVKGLDTGADDYISKPFSVIELVARIRANLRKNNKDVITNLKYKDIRIDHIKHEIMVSGKLLQTSLKEYNLLSLFCENYNKIQVRDHIFKKIWGESYIGESRTLDVHIKELRKKLAEAGSEVEIKTVRGVGYMLI
jgi:two-component system alkaline phosphatase synthesis response regulator PhoP